MTSTDTYAAAAQGRRATEKSVDVFKRGPRA